MTWIEWSMTDFGSQIEAFQVVDFEPTTTRREPLVRFSRQ